MLVWLNGASKLKIGQTIEVFLGIVSKSLVFLVRNGLKIVFFIKRSSVNNNSTVGFQLPENTYLICKVQSVNDI
jgi:hypothetical protein